MIIRTATDKGQYVDESDDNLLRDLVMTAAVVVMAVVEA